jgi:hypothetical protein
MRRRTFVAGFAVAVAATAFALGSRVGAEEPPGGMPSPAKKIDHPFLKEMVGTWDFVTETGTGSTTVRLALGDTAIVEDLESQMGPGMPYFGHGVRKVADDGKTMTLWWFDSFSPEPDVYTGALAADGYDIKSKDQRITMKKTATGFEFKMFAGDTPLFGAQYVKRK